MTAQIIFYRGSTWTDRMRAYSLFINDEECGRIKRNKQVTVEVPAGQHWVEAGIDWCGSNIVEINLNDGDVAEFDIRNPHGPWRGMSVMRQTPGKYLELTLR